MIPEFQKGYVCGYSVNSATYASYMNIGQYLDHRQCSPGATIRHQVHVSDDVKHVKHDQGYSHGGRDYYKYYLHDGRANCSSYSQDKDNL